MRTGSEIVVRDLALRFVERGHQVVVYSPTIGEFSEELTSRGIPVTNNLLAIEHPPDVIHGHHMPVTAEAILAFPQVPAIWVCHDSTSWFDQPPRFSQVRRVFAVDETCRARLSNSDRIPPEKVGILPNAVDLRRCVERPSALRDKPAHAVSLVKHSGLEAAIQQACDHFGIELQAYGHGVGRPVDDIERLCANSDIVFGTARTALEAMAAGAAVVLVDGRGFGGLVTSENYERGRRLNFGLGMLTQETTPSGLIEAIASYNAQDAAIVSERVKKEADLELTISRLEDIYRSIIDEAANAPMSDPEAFRREQMEFYRSWLVHIELWDSTELLAQQATLNENLASQTARVAALQDQIGRMERSRSVRLAKFIRRYLGLSR